MPFIDISIRGLLMYDRLKFLGYLTAAVGSGFVNDPAVLLMMLLFVFLLVKDRAALLKRAFLPYLLFGVVVTVLYGFMEGVDAEFLLLFNLRLFLLLFLGLWVASSVNFFMILPKKAATALHLAFSLIREYRNDFEEFWMAVRSRWAKESFFYWIKALKSMGFKFLQKSLYSSEEITLGMRSRGFLDD